MPDSQPISNDGLSISAAGAYVYERANPSASLNLNLETFSPELRNTLTSFRQAWNSRKPIDPQVTLALMDCEEPQVGRLIRELVLEPVTSSAQQQNSRATRFITAIADYIRQSADSKSNTLTSQLLNHIPIAIGLFAGASAVSYSVGLASNAIVSLGIATTTGIYTFFAVSFIGCFIRGYTGKKIEKLVDDLNFVYDQSRENFKQEIRMREHLAKLYLGNLNYPHKVGFLLALVDKHPTVDIQEVINSVSILERKIAYNEGRITKLVNSKVRDHVFIGLNLCIGLDDPNSDYYTPAVRAFYVRLYQQYFASDPRIADLAQARISYYDLVKNSKRKGN